MKCHVCGGRMDVVSTDLPFKTGPSTIVILKGLPVHQCGNCPEYLIDDSVMRRVDDLLEKVDSAAELEIVKYAA